MTSVETRVRRAFDVWNEVPLVAQTTGMSCWAAAAAMLVGWRESIVVDPDAVARGAGRWQEFQNGLHPVDVAGLAAAWRLVMEQRDDVWEVDEFRSMLERHGPLWVGEASPGLHAIIVTGIYGDGSPDGTRVRVNDPWPVGVGERYTLTFRQLRQNFEAASRLTGDRAHVLHSGGRSRGPFHHWRSETRTTRITREGKDDAMKSNYGRGPHAEALDVAAGERYIDTTAGGTNPLTGHGGSGENVYLAWTAIPDGAMAIDVVVHLHGYSPSPPTRAMLREKVAESGLDLTGRTRPTLAILPRGRKITDQEVEAERRAQRKVNPRRYTFPALLAQQGRGLETLIQYALAFVSREVLGGRTIQRSRLILTAHSGGGLPLNDLVANHERLAVCNPHEVHIFDALYWPATGIAHWLRSRATADAGLAAGAQPDAALAREGGGCRVVYLEGDTAANSTTLARAFPSAPALRPAYRAERTTVVHDNIPRVFGRALLTDVRANLVLVPARGHGIVEPLGLEAAALAVDDDARAWLERDEAGRQALATSVRGWIGATDRSGIELVADAARRRHFLEQVNWQQQDFKGRGPRTGESEALFTAMSGVVPERRANVMIAYHNVDATVVAVPGSGGRKLYPEAKDAFVRMREAAAADRVPLTMVQGWRSQTHQARLRERNPNPAAVAQGRSSHEYGLAVDLVMSVAGLAFSEVSTGRMPNIVAMYRSPVYKWMALNGRRFGWFPYRREPWHWEYNPVGFKERFEAAAPRTGGYGAPMGLFQEYPRGSMDEA